jgi:eukaryotic-like serine/threonine-protein kinase
VVSLAPWLLLMFVYAMFIPNTWRRAAIVLGGIALLPLAVIAALGVLDPASRAALALDATMLTQNALAILVAAIVCVLGVKTIGALRTEAYEARQLGQYHLRHKLGAGGMGEVFLAEHQLLKRPCAIKLIRPEKAGDPQVLARFEREVQAAAKLSHWNSIEIFDYGRTAEGVFYYVMEYLPGLNLQEIVERSGPLPPERVVHLLRQACRALREAHEMGLLHRDLKPANIFAAQRGGVYDVAKILDFGLVKPTSQRGSIELTQEGVVTGSPLYMSPEQASGEEADVRSDIYALGCVAYFLLTGRPPFLDEKPMKVLLAHAKDAPAQPSALYGGVPADLEQVVLRCLAKSPEERYQSAEELEAALAATSSADRWSDADAAEWWNGHEVKASQETLELAMA